MPKLEPIAIAITIAIQIKIENNKIRINCCAPVASFQIG